MLFRSNHTVEFAADNSATVTVGGVTGTCSGNFGSSSVATKITVPTSAGVVSISATVKNESSTSGNPAGVAIVIKDSSGKQVWDTKAWVENTYSYTTIDTTNSYLVGGDATAVGTGFSYTGSFTEGQNGQSKLSSEDGGGGGGSGGGRYAGPGGAKRTGDQGAEKGRTAQSYINTQITTDGSVVNGLGANPPKLKYSVGSAGSGGASTGATGENGYAVFEFETLTLPWAKVSGTWLPTTNAYAKVGGNWKTITDVYVKQNGAWKKITQGTKPSFSPIASNFGDGGNRSYA